jgi:hypothetical protein
MSAVHTLDGIALQRDGRLAITVRIETGTGGSDGRYGGAGAAPDPFKAILLGMTSNLGEMD